MILFAGALSLEGPIPATKGKTTYKRRHGIEETHRPRIVFYGDSHIGRLLTWYLHTRGLGTADMLEKELLDNSKFIYSGGSRWDTVHNRVQGIEVPEHQRQGNLWDKVMRQVTAGEYKPEYVFISCSGNDLDKWNDSLYTAIRRSKIWHILVHAEWTPSIFYQKNHHNWYDDRVIPPVKPQKLDIEDFLSEKRYKMCVNIDAVVGVLKDAFPSTKMYALGTIGRENWCPAVTKQIPLVNKYLEDKHSIRVCTINGYLLDKHMDDDRIHLSNEGYRLLVNKALGPLVDRHVSLYY